MCLNSYLNVATDNSEPCLYIKLTAIKEKKSSKNQPHTE